MVTKASIAFMPHKPYWEDVDRKKLGVVCFKNNEEMLDVFIYEHIFVTPQNARLEPASLAGVPSIWHDKVQYTLFVKTDDTGEWKLAGWLSTLPAAWPLPDFVPSQDQLETPC